MGVWSRWVVGAVAGVVAAAAACTPTVAPPTTTTITGATTTTTVPSGPPAYDPACTTTPTCLVSTYGGNGARPLAISDHGLMASEHIGGNQLSNSIELLDVANRTFRTVFTAINPIDVAMTADGSRLALTASGAGGPIPGTGLYVFDPATGTTSYPTQPRPGGYYQSPSISADGRWVVVTQGTADPPADTTVLLFDLQLHTYQVIGEFTADSAGVARISADGSTVVWGDDVGTWVSGITVWDRAGASVVAQFPGDGPSVSGDGGVVAFDADHDAYQADSLGIWNRSTDSVTTLGAGQGLGFGPVSVSTDGSHVIAGQSVLGAPSAVGSHEIADWTVAAGGFAVLGGPDPGYTPYPSLAAVSPDASRVIWLDGPGYSNPNTWSAYLWVRP